MSTDPRLDELLLRWEEQRRQGHDTDPEELCRDCPELLAPLRSHIQALRAMDRMIDLDTPKEAATPLPPGERSSSGPLPARLTTHSTYQVLHCHARGGLGEVLRARDEVLDREVALKRLLPDGSHLAERCSRFLREAVLTSRLEHPGIVPVYGLGQDEAGRPCYAMRFIEGESLHEAIRRFHETGGPDEGARRLLLRQLLGRFVGVCNAVAYAHSKGVIHRDLKPANIMLGAYGEALVVDWGLAKTTDPSPAAATRGEGATVQEDGDLSALTTLPEPLPPATGTQTGVAMGTPVYMSPEQAAGRWADVGPGSDVYGLGATLYALLTGMAPVAGRSAAQVLDRVRRGDFPRPRQVQPAVPPALEAVCLKAMALRPADRYATALALAADVEHFLADEPVSVYHDPLTVRLGRWVRRHRTPVAAAAALLLTTLVALVVSNVLIRRERDEKDRAYRTADEQRRRAVDYFRLARQAVDENTTRLAQDPRLRAHGLDEVRRPLLQSAVTFYQKFLDIGAGDPEVEAERGRARRRLALVTREIASTAEAAVQYRQAVDSFDQLAREHPEDLGFRLELAQSWRDLGSAYAETGKHEEAAAALGEARGLLESLVAAHPDSPAYREDLAQTYTSLGKLHQTRGRLEDAEAAYGKARGLWEELLRAAGPVPDVYREHLAACLSDQGHLFRNTQRPDEGERAYRAALDLRAALAAAHPEDGERQAALASSHYNMGTFYLSTGKRAEAAESLREARRLQEELVRRHPAILDYQSDLGMTHYTLGKVLQELERWAESLAEYEAARAAFAKLSETDPAVLVYAQRLALCLDILGRAYLREARNGDAEKAYLEALRIRERLTREYPDVPELRLHLGNSYNNLGILYDHLGQPADTERVCRKAVEVYGALKDAYPQVPQYAVELANALDNLGLLYEMTGRLKEALRCYADAQPLLDEVLRREPQHATARRYLAVNHGARAETLTVLGRHAEAIEEWDLGLSLDARPARQAEFRGHRALNLAHLGDHARARADVEELAAAKTVSGSLLYTLACASATCSVAALRDSRLGEVEQKKDTRRESPPGAVPIEGVSR
jgi:serine/threonine protein kinase/tetratricopeptide (TPR) repeat protein